MILNALSPLTVLQNHLGTLPLVVCLYSPTKHVRTKCKTTWSCYKPCPIINCSRHTCTSKETMYSQSKNYQNSLHSSSASEEIPHIFLYWAYNSPSMIPVLNQNVSVHTLKSYFFKILFNISILLLPGLPSGLFPSSFSH